jgi:hypothetical protein
MPLLRGELELVGGAFIYAEYQRWVTCTPTPRPLPYEGMLDVGCDELFELTHNSRYHAPHLDSVHIFIFNFSFVTLLSIALRLFLLPFGLSPLSLSLLSGSVPRARLSFGTIRLACCCCCLSSFDGSDYHRFVFYLSLISSSSAYSSQNIFSILSILALPSWTLNSFSSSFFPR